jgi:hypothetical protein
MNVPPDSLAIARGMQKNIPGWARKRRQEMAKSGKPARKSARKKARPKPKKRSRGKSSRRR